MEKNLFEMEGVDKKWERLVWNAGINGFTSTVFTLYVRYVSQLNALHNLIFPSEHLVSSHMMGKSKDG